MLDKNSFFIALYNFIRNCCEQQTEDVKMVRKNYSEEQEKMSYTLLGVVLILILEEGSSMFGIQKTIGTWGELALGPLLFLIGLFMLFGDQLNFPRFGFQGNADLVLR